MTPTVSVIVTNYNGGTYLLECLRSLLGQDDVLEIIVVDNASIDGSLNAAKDAFRDILVVQHHTNLGVAAASNSGASVARGDVLLFVDHDATLEAGCVHALASALSGVDGIAGPVIRHGGGPAEWGSTIDRLGHPTSLSSPGEPFFLNHAVFATTRKLFDRLGGFDARYFYAAEEVDFCWRALLGEWPIAVVGDARANHVGGTSTPGGYVRSGRPETTAFRIQYRECNTLTTFLKCSPRGWLAWLIPAYALKVMGVAIVALYMRRPQLAVELMRGLWINVRRWPETRRLRRAIERTRRGEQMAAARMHRGLIALDTVRRHGLPRFVDGRRSPTG